LRRRNKPKAVLAGMVSSWLSRRGKSRSNAWYLYIGVSISLRVFAPYRKCALRWSIVPRLNINSLSSYIFAVVVNCFTCFPIRLEVLNCFFVCPMSLTSLISTNILVFSKRANNILVKMETSIYCIASRQHILKYQGDLHIYYIQYIVSIFAHLFQR
jgi:hypothetical protein